MINNKVLALAGLLVIASAVVHASGEGAKKGSLKTFINNHYGKALTALGVLSLNSLTNGFVANIMDKDSNPCTYNWYQGPNLQTINLPFTIGAKLQTTEGKWYNLFKHFTWLCLTIKGDGKAHLTVINRTYASS